MNWKGVDKINLIELTLKDKLNLCKKIMTMKGCSKEYTIKELLEEK